MALALVLRILDEFPRHRSQKGTDAWYLQKDRRCQCRLTFRRTSLEHRRLRFSFQINDFKDPGTDLSVPPFIARLRRRRRFSRLGDPCQAVLFAKNLFHQPTRETPETGGGGDLPTLQLPVKLFFLQKNLSPKTRPEDRKRRRSTDPRTPCQPAFSNRRKPRNRSLTTRRKPPPKPSPKDQAPDKTNNSDSVEARKMAPTAENRKSELSDFLWAGRCLHRVPARRPARFRARRLYRQGSLRPQAKSRGTRK